MSILPGVAAYRNTLREKAIDRLHSKGKRGSSVLWSESLGNYTTPLLGAAAGGLTGLGLYALAMALDKETKISKGDLAAFLGRGAAIGGGLGLATNVGGLISGLIKGKRTAKEHAAYLAEENSPLLKNYLIPGAAGYHVGRRLMSRIQRSI